MAEEQKETAKPNGAGAEAAAGAEGAALAVLHQYLKDFSFENPLGPDYPGRLKEAPRGTVRVDVRVKPVTPPDIEVSVFLGVEAKAGDTLVYSVECDYAGLFRVGKMPPEHVLPVIMIEAPRLLFPFARQVIAAAVAAGGFPPLLIQPIDFVALFREKRGELLESLKRQQEAEAGKSQGSA